MSYVHLPQVEEHSVFVFRLANVSGSQFSALRRPWLWVFGWEAKRCGINHRVWTQDCQRFPGLTRGLIADNFQAAGWGLDGLLFCSLLLIVIFIYRPHVCVWAWPKCTRGVCTIRHIVSIARVTRQAKSTTSPRPSISRRSCLIPLLIRTLWKN